MPTAWRAIMASAHNNIAAVSRLMHRQVNEAMGFAPNTRRELDTAQLEEALDRGFWLWRDQPIDPNLDEKTRERLLARPPRDPEELRQNVAVYAAFIHLASELPIDFRDPGDSPPDAPATAQSSR